MEKNRLFQVSLIILVIILSSKAEGIAQESPVAFLYVKQAKNQKVVVKHKGELKWEDVDKYAQLFPNDSLKIPENATIILGDTKSQWQEYEGPKLIIIKKENKNESDFSNYIDRIYATIFKEKDRRRAAFDAARSIEELKIALPDTIFAFEMPEIINWLTNEPWWTEYRINIIHDQKMELDTVVSGKTLRLDQNAKKWTKAGFYQIKVSLVKNDFFESSADSCAINIMHGKTASKNRKKLEALKDSISKNESLDDYFALANFCLTEKLYLDLETTLFEIIKKFPNNLEPQMMLYAYYSAFFSPKQSDALIRHRKE